MTPRSQDKATKKEEGKITHHIRTALQLALRLVVLVLVVWIIALVVVVALISMAVDRVVAARARKINARNNNDTWSH